MSSSEHAQDGEPDNQTMDIFRALEDIRSKSKRRREADKKAIETEYRAKIQAAQAKIEKIKEAHEAKVAAAQTQQYATLRHLLHKRQLLELEIWRSVQRVEGARTDLAKTLDGVYAERLEACLEVLSTGKVR